MLPIRFRERQAESGGHPSSEPISDCCFLIIVVLCSELLYIHRLGFYSDDWSQQQLLAACPDSTTIGRFRCLYAEGLEYRPLQAVQLAILYSLFGPVALGYHIYNALLLAGIALLLYAVTVELALPRPATVSIPLVFCLLPHYSTDRFWIAAFQANLSVALFLGGLYCALRATSRRPRASLLWVPASAIGLTLGALAYEIVIPLFVLVPVTVWQRTEKRKQFRLWFASVIVVVTGIVVWYKLLTQDRVAFHGRFLTHLDLVAAHFGHQLMNFVYVYYGLGLPYVAWKAISNRPDPNILLLGVPFAVGVLGYLLHAARDSGLAWMSWDRWARILLAGTMIFALGYSPFVADISLDLTSPGVVNRIAIAAALGTAVTLVALGGWGTCVVRSPTWRVRFFCAYMTILCTSSFIIVNVIASYWNEARVAQNDIVSSLRNQFPTIPSRTTLLLDGVCPYVGPGIVFEGTWDTEGMLRVVYNDSSLKGTILRSDTEVRDDGIHAYFYGEVTRYPYNDNLVVFDWRRHAWSRLPDFSSARGYFSKRRYREDERCPRGKEGYGSSSLRAGW